MRRRFLGLILIAICGLLGLSATPKNSEIKEWKAKIGTTYYLYPGIPVESRPMLRSDKNIYSSKIVPINEPFKLIGVYKDSLFDSNGPQLEFKVSETFDKTNGYLYSNEFKVNLVSGEILDHVPHVAAPSTGTIADAILDPADAVDPKPLIVKNIEHKNEKEVNNTNIFGIFLLVIFVILVAGVFIFILKRRSSQKAESLQPAIPPPHPVLRSWLCASCGWLGFVGRNGNPYAAGVGVGAAATGAGAAGVVAGGVGLAGGVVVMLVGAAVFVIGIPLLFVFLLGIPVMILGVVIIVIGGIISLVGGTAAGAGATIAATGAAAGAGAYAKGQAHTQRALPCPICKQALIPCASTMGKEFITNHPDVLRPLGPPIQEWLEYVRFYEHETGTMIPSEPWPGANQIPALAVEEPLVIEDQVSELPDTHPTTS